MNKKLLIFAAFLCIFYFGIPAEAGEKRYISLAPSTTEILFALGLDKEIVGISTFCNYPPQVKDKIRVGTFSYPDTEKIIALKPDIVFCTGLEQAVTITKLKQLKLTVFVSDPSNMQELFQSIIGIGKTTGRLKEAQDLVSNMKKQIQNIDTRNTNKPKVFIEIWNTPLMTAGGASFINELISIAGGINIAEDINKAYLYLSPEQVVSRNPDYIILTYMSGEQPDKALQRRIGWKDISAVKNNHVYNDIDPDLLIRPGPRMVEGIKELNKRIHQ